MNGTADPAQARRARLRELLRRDEMTVMPGGFSPIYARAAELAGFESFFLAGSQMAAFLLGVPDTGVIGLRDIVDHARHVAAHTEIPILLDADTGFGSAVNVHFSVQECVRSGVAGLSIEDQEAPKKSATNAGRRCIAAAEAIGKYRAAVAARDALDPGFVICARCDAIGAEHGSFEEALARCQAYVREADVDLVWLNSIQTLEQVERACAEIPAPVLIIWGGASPAPSLDEFRRRGVKIVLYPTIAASSGLQAAWHLLNDFRARGTPALEDWAQRVKATQWGAVDLKTLTRAGDVRAIEEQFLPADQQRDYATTFGHDTQLGFGETASRARRETR
jgi:2-methylisocitrate lyase-like PEP mutase family enzyme